MSSELRKRLRAAEGIVVALLSPTVVGPAIFAVIFLWTVWVTS